MKEKLNMSNKLILTHASDGVPVSVVDSVLIDEVVSLMDRVSILEFEVEKLKHPKSGYVLINEHELTEK